MTTGENRELFETMPVYRALVKMCVPTVIGQMVVLLYNLADTFFIGRTGNPYMVAGTSLILPVFNLSNAISGFVGVGAGTLISRLMGAQRDDEASKVSSYAFYFAIVVSAVYAAAIFIFRTPIMLALGASKDTFTFASQYLMMVVILGGVPTIVQLTMAQLLRAVGLSREAGTGVTLGGILNIALDPLFMFVILPEGQEVIGAGIATMLSNVASFIYFIVQIRKAGKTTVLRLSPHTGKPGRSLIREMLIGGVPAGVSNLLFDFSQIMINRLMSAYGDIALAGIGIVLKAERIPLNTGVGICQGMMPIVAYNFASGDHKRMKKVMNQSRLAGLVVAGLAIILYELLAPQIMHVFISSPETEALGADFLRVRCLATPLMFICFHMLYAFQAMGKAVTGFWMAFIRQLALYVPLLILMDYVFGMYGLVWTQMVSDGIMTGISFVFYWRLIRQLQAADRLS